MLFFTDNLNLDELCLLMLSVPKERDAGDTRRNRNQTCRQLIVIEANVIAAPHDIHENIMQIILPRTFYNSGKFQAHLTKLGLTQEKAMAVTNRDYQACFHYSLLVKLAPHWNQMGSPNDDDGVVLLQGANFLTTKKVIPALKLEVVAATHEIQISLQSFNIKMPIVKFTQFGVTSSIAREFSAKRIDVIPDKHIKRQWCYILPTLKMGKVVEIMREVPSYSTNLRQYSDFKTFWKNNYGFQLPSRNDFYYGVQLLRIGRVLTYPRCCILPSKPTMWAVSETTAPHITSFINDVNLKMSIVCSQGLNFIPRTTALPTNLCPASDINGGDSESNASNVTDGQ